MSELAWHIPQLSEREEVTRFLPPGGSCRFDCSFNNIFLWQREFATEIAFCHDCLLIRWWEKDGSTVTVFPVGDAPEKRARAFRALEEDCRPAVLDWLTQNDADELLSIRHEVYALAEHPELEDYIYAREDLEKLPGRKLMRKRNGVSQFWRRHPEAVTREITPENFADVRAVAQAWHNQACVRQPENAPEFAAEMTAIDTALHNWTALQMRGLLLYAENRPAAMAILSALNRDTADVHFEKVHPDFVRDYAYAVINQETARRFTEYLWFNREEDLGDPDLRQAKLSYRPAEKIRRFRAVKINTGEENA